MKETYATANKNWLTTLTRRLPKNDINNKKCWICEYEKKGNYGLITYIRFDKKESKSELLGAWLPVAG